MPPILYLVRHAHASDAASDEIRELSHRGRDQVRKLASLLRAGGAFAPEEVWYSPLVRARETAELLLSELHLKPACHVRRELEPEADPARVMHLLAKSRASIALFGHEPHMSALATQLITGETGPVAFVFKKATVLALEFAGSHWCVRWQISPDLFGD